MSSIAKMVELFGTAAVEGVKGITAMSYSLKTIAEVLAVMSDDDMALSCVDDLAKNLQDLYNTKEEDVE